MTYSFPNFEPVHFSMSGSNFFFLTCIQVFQEAGKVAWYSHLYKNFPQFVLIDTVKGFSFVSEAEVDFFSGIPFLFLWSNSVGNLISHSSAFSKSSLNIWKFLAHKLLTLSLKHFKHYLVNMWNEFNCMVVRTFFGIALLQDWNENWAFPVLWPLLSFQICWYIAWSTLTASSFRIWTS